MKNNDQTTQTRRKWSFTHEMQQAFVDWVKKLPFITRDIPKDPERQDREEESAEQVSASPPTHGRLAGRP
jgi:hypothetical protein